MSSSHYFIIYKKLTLPLLLSPLLFGCASNPIQSQNTNKQDSQLFFGGPILTMQGSSPHYVEALVVKHGRIKFAGDLKQAKNVVPE